MSAYRNLASALEDDKVIEKCEHLAVQARSVARDVARLFVEADRVLGAAVGRKDSKNDIIEKLNVLEDRAAEIKESRTDAIYKAWKAQEACK